jgi:hypothetical protein
MFRVIFHLDMDAFYASVEQRDDLKSLDVDCLLPAHLVEERIQSAQGANLRSIIAAL